MPRWRRSAKAGAAKPTKAPKFRHEACDTWGGRGPRPTWLREVPAAGKDLEEFAA